MKYVILLIVYLSCSGIDAQLNWTWSQSTNNQSHGAGNMTAGTAVDAAGNTYATGFITDTVTLGGFLLQPRPIGDVIIIKYDPLGNVKWAKLAQGTGDGAVGEAIAVAGNGDVYVAGWLATPGKFGTINVPVNGFVDYAFFTRLDSNGNFIWAKAASGLEGWSADQLSYHLSIDQDDDNISIHGLVQW